MDYEFLKNWIYEIAGLIAAILVIVGFIKPVMNFFAAFPQQIIKFLKFGYIIFKNAVPFVWKKTISS
ncbi:MAG: hypothetical protein Q8K75_02020 [Chlamydiales bacterium]|nr:hypothetical protein [Chlamydiales bacterium]